VRQPATWLQDGPFVEVLARVPVARHRERILEQNYSRDNES